jgi:prevent-host-death family protein
VAQQPHISAKAYGDAKRLGARAARTQFADLLGQVHYGHETVIIERAGKPMAALVPLEVVEQYVAARERFFAVVDEIQRGMPDVPQAEVEADVAEAVAAARAAQRNG